MTEKKSISGIGKILSGIAGVHYVVSELSLRGLIALPTVRNTAGFDIVVTSPDGSWHANLQVKSSKDKVYFWNVGKNYRKLRGNNKFFVFVRYLKKDSRFEAFLEKADQVADDVEADVKERESRGSHPRGSWHLPKTKEGKERVHRQWLEFPKIMLETRQDSSQP